ncbi:MULTISPECIES: hypothetical protein [Okeania]|uniref:hypothetical protein n=1 Tax=Okeania TaxID=1458928 RepID=UPI000F529687|nr:MULTISPECIES: hypothetical protein [Okeania]NET11873.1 hypothetical protein [Okeania sp. SIO1H6]NES78965.1 hypothetical protein [Okeania sp. SIO1H4]NES88931.1 hypothetical protein [Okeania sp. SIO2B9]NET22740.1 hypothetical protein [Okeania sp. SIO1H5]NET76903.1 hypothetical protein [Okeania sp. SIO1F9]
MYDINLNYLGVRSQPTPRPSPSQEGKSGVRREERRRKSSRGRKFFVCALIRTRYHTSFHQRLIFKLYLTILKSAIILAAEVLIADCYFNF